jgi:hypothetical protein
LNAKAHECFLSLLALSLFYSSTVAHPSELPPSPHQVVHHFSASQRLLLIAFLSLLFSFTVVLKLYQEQQQQHHQLSTGCRLIKPNELKTFMRKTLLQE